MADLLYCALLIKITSYFEITYEQRDLQQRAATAVKTGLQ